MAKPTFNPEIVADDVLDTMLNKWGLWKTIFIVFVLWTKKKSLIKGMSIRKVTRRIRGEA